MTNPSRSVHNPVTEPGDTCYIGSGDAGISYGTDLIKRHG
ncbi:hypothetical protein NONI108955_32030 [Nocardia ninae]